MSRPPTSASTLSERDCWAAAEPAASQVPANIKKRIPKRANRCRIRRSLKPGWGKRGRFYHQRTGVIPSPPRGGRGISVRDSSARQKTSGLGMTERCRHVSEDAGGGGLK